MQNMCSATEPWPLPVCGQNGVLCGIPDSIRLATSEISALLHCILSLIQVCREANNPQPARSVKEE